MRPSNLQLAESIESILRQKIQPCLAEHEVLPSLHLIFDMLREIRGSSCPDNNDLSEVEVAGLELLRVKGVASDVAEDNLPQERSSKSIAIEAIGEKLCCEVRGANLGTLDSDWLREVLTWETRQPACFVTPLDSMAQQLPSSSPVPDCAEFSDFLNSSGVFNDPIQVTSITPLAGGFSRKVFRVDAQLGGTNFSLVARCSVPDGLLDGGFACLREEYRAMQAAHQQNFPCPEIYHYEPDTRWFGGDFLLMEFKQGEILGNALGSEGAVDESKLHQICTLLAQLHRLQWTDEAGEGSSETGSPRRALTDAIRDQLERIERYWRENTEEPSSLIEFALKWLYANISSVEGHPVLVHGDVGFHNLLYASDDLSALIDWETSHMGCAAEDLTYALTSLKDAVDRDNFLQWYHEAGGVEQGESSLDYCEILNMLRNTIVCHVGLAKYKKNPALQPALYELATKFRMHFQSELQSALTSVLE